MNADWIKLKEAPIETPGGIGTLERYHAPLMRANKSIRDSMEKLGRMTPVWLWLFLKLIETWDRRVYVKNY